MAIQIEKTLLLMFYYDGQFPWNVPNLLYLPYGVIYKYPFRYDKKWISESLRDKEKLLLKDALIVMKFQALEKTSSQEYIPIRQVKILHHEQIGDYYYLYFSLGNFVKYNNQSLSQFSPLFRKSLNGKDQNILIENVSFIERIELVNHTENQEEINSWLRMAKLFNSKFEPEMKEFENTVFLKFQALSSEKQKAIEPQPLFSQWKIKYLIDRSRKSEKCKSKLIGIYEKLANPGFYGYKLSVNTKYSIQIIQFFRPDINKVFKPLDAHLLLEAPSDTFFTSISKNSIIGHQDILNFSFVTTKHKFLGSTLKIIPSINPSPKYVIGEIPEKYDLLIPEISINVSIHQTVKSILCNYVFPIMIFLLGSLLVTVSTSTDLSLPWLSGDNKVLQLVFGFTFQAIGLYIVNKKDMS